MSAPASSPAAAGDREAAGLAAILDSLSLAPQDASRAAGSNAPPPGGAAIHVAASASASSEDRSRFANLIPSSDHDDDDDDDEDGGDDEEEGGSGSKSNRILPANRWHFIMYTNTGIDCGARRPIILISRRAPGWTEFHDAVYALEQKGGFLPTDRWSTNDDPAGTFVFLRKDVIPLAILEKAAQTNRSIAHCLICSGYRWTDEERKAYFDAARADLQSLGCVEDARLSEVVDPEEGYEWEPVPQQIRPA